MQKIYTLGGINRKKQFSYGGSIDTGVTLQFGVKTYVSAQFFKEILDQFAGRTIPGGFSMTDPTPNGLGQWVKDNSKRLNGMNLTPRHASFIAAILVHEEFITSGLKGNAVYLDFA